jgi:hypothetical protein
MRIGAVELTLSAVWLRLYAATHVGRRFSALPLCSLRRKLKMR